MRPGEPPQFVSFSSFWPPIMPCTQSRFSKFINVINSQLLAQPEIHKGWYSMAQNKTTSAQKNGQQTVTGPVLWKEGPPFAGVDSKEASPLSLSQGAHTVARDRWERLSVVHEISASPEEIWHALTNPEALSQWFGACHGGSLDQSSHECVLDFEDGEFFLCRGVEARPPYHLQYRWRWRGIGPVWTVTWQIEPISENRTRVAMHEDALNPPNRWQHWNGEGWPGILDQ